MRPDALDSHAERFARAKPDTGIRVSKSNSIGEQRIGETDNGEPLRVAPFSGRRERIAKGLHLQWHYRRDEQHSMSCEWEPALPRRLTRQMRRAYEGARARFMQELATRADMANVVLELDGDGAVVYGGEHRPAKAGHA